MLTYICPLCSAIYHTDIPSQVSCCGGELDHVEPYFSATEIFNDAAMHSCDACPDCQYNRHYTDSVPYGETHVLRHTTTCKASFPSQCPHVCAQATHHIQTHLGDDLITDLLRLHTSDDRIVDLITQRLDCPHATAKRHMHAFMIYVACGDRATL